MYGAILGDIIGSPFEFDRGDKTKDFDLFTKGCGFTDDSVMTVAVAEALLAIERDASVEEIEKTVTATNGDEFLVPYISDTPLMSDEQVLKAQRSQVVHIEQDTHMKMETVMNENDETEWMCAFTSPEEMNKGTKGNVRISRPIKDLIMQAMDWEQVSGMVINPFGHYMRMDKALIQNVIEAYNHYV